MAEKLLLDTDILIDYLRDRPEAVAYLESLKAHLLVSVITVAELYAGVRDGAERTRLDRFMAVFQTVPLEHEIAVRGGCIAATMARAMALGLPTR